jgi:prepilin-type N-terminal cleavage/methylation domain-containing protein
VRWIRLFSRNMARLHGEQSGFTIIESMVAITILAVGSFAVAQSLDFGLKATGISRQKTQAEALIQEQVERVRALSFASVGLDAVDQPIAHSSNPDNPDYWVASSQTYDPDGPSSIAPEPLVFLSPGILHLQSSTIQGTTYTVYVWVTSSTIAATHDAKRVTIEVTWPDHFRNRISSYRVSSLFASDQVAFAAATTTSTNQVPTVGCPTPLADSSGNVVSPVSFSAVAADADGTIARIDWNFGDGTATVVGGGVAQTHTFPSTDGYTIVNTVTDDKGGVATNSALHCTVYVQVGTDRNEVQLITLTGATGGHFTLTFDGETTSCEIAYNAPASIADGGGSVQHALQACLAKLGTGDVVVSGNAGGPYTVTFEGAYGGMDVPQMTCNYSGMLEPVHGSNSASCAVTTVTQGMNGGSGGGGGFSNRPSGSIIINGGAPYTNNALVTLGLTATSGTGGHPVTDMQFGTDGVNFGSWIAWPGGTTVLQPYTLVAQGSTTVYVQFKDSVGHVSEAPSDAIFLDNAAPGAFTISAIARGTGGKKGTPATTVTFSYGAATDPAPSSGAPTYYVEYRIGAAAFAPAPGCAGSTATVQICLPIATGVTYGARIRAVDPAGNTTYSDIRTF